MQWYIRSAVGKLLQWSSFESSIMEYTIPISCTFPLFTNGHIITTSSVSNSQSLEIETDIRTVPVVLPGPGSKHTWRATHRRHAGHVCNERLNHWKCLQIILCEVDFQQRKSGDGVNCEPIARVGQGLKCCTRWSEYIMHDIDDDGVRAQVQQWCCWQFKMTEMVSTGS